MFGFLFWIGFLWFHSTWTHWLFIQSTRYKGTHQVEFLAQSSTMLIKNPVSEESKMLRVLTSDKSSHCARNCSCLLRHTYLCFCFCLVFKSDAIVRQSRECQLHSLDCLSQYQTCMLMQVCVLEIYSLLCGTKCWCYCSNVFYRKLNWQRQRPLLSTTWWTYGEWCDQWNVEALE